MSELKQTDEIKENEITGLNAFQKCNKTSVGNETLLGWIRLKYREQSYLNPLNNKK